MSAPLRLAIDEADAAALQAHLLRTDADFMPRLSSRVQLADYAAKLRLLARSVELWHGDSLAGLVAIYCNAEPGGAAFITSVSLEPSWRGQGWADQLVERACELAREARLTQVRLELHCDNQPARRLYERLGFTPGAVLQQMLPMQRLL